MTVCIVIKNSQLPHPDAPRRLKTLSVISRSYQETKEKYETVENYFKKHFQKADVCFLSSHAANDRDVEEIKEMIEYGKRFFYNIGAIFLSNEVDRDTVVHETISNDLNFDESFYLENPKLNDKSQINNQIYSLALDFSELIIRRSHTQ